MKRFRSLPYFFLVVDVGFIAYWLITALHIIPDEYLYNDYTNEILVHWNWSFFPLDMLISATGLTSVYLYRKEKKAWKGVALISLVLTTCSGLQAISFWIYHHDYNLTWWLPNLFLLIYPFYFIYAILNSGYESDSR